MRDDLAALKRRLVVGHKSDGRSVYDGQAKSELVALCLQPGASVSHLAREFDVNANLLTRWLREQAHGSSPRTAVARVVSTPSAFVAVPVVPTPASDANASANLYSLLQTCRVNGIDGFRYLRALLLALPNAKTVDDYADLLPWRINLAAAA